MTRLLILLLLFTTAWLSSCRQGFFRNSSGSMENTLMAGQKFYVTSADRFERNDIVTFDYFGNDYGSPTDETGQYKQHWEKRVCRLIAYSGDIVEIKEGEVFISGRHIPLPPLAKVYYELRSRLYIEELDKQDSYMTNMEKSGDTFIYKVMLSGKDAAAYRQNKADIISVNRMLPDQTYAASDTVFARSAVNDSWTPDNYGPLRIPAPGESITVDAGNYKLYKNIPGIQPGKNIIKEKLYFLLGDNRYGAEDSRYIGLISHSKMMGIVK